MQCTNMSERDFVSYLEEVKEELNKLKNETGSFEERRHSTELLVSNVLQEFSENASSVVIDPICSRIFDLIFPEASLSSLVSFLQQLIDHLIPISTNPFGSHVCEHLLSAIFQKLDSNPIPKLIDKVLSDLCQTIGSAVSEFLVNKFATHILRQLISLLSGVDTMAFIKAPTHKQVGVTNIEMNSRLKTKHQAHSQFSKYFNELAMSIQSFLKNQTAEEIQCLVSNSSSSPTLQSLIVALSATNDPQSRDFISLFLVHTETRLVCESFEVKLMMEGKVSSHLLEVLLRVAPQDVLEKIYKDCFACNALKMALHPTANYPLQAAISRFRSSDMLKDVVDELGPHFHDILNKKRTGVIVALFCKGLELESDQEELCQYLDKAVKKIKLSESKTRFCQVLLCHGTEAELGQNFLKLSHKGCILLETLLHYPTEKTKPFLMSLKALNDRSIQHLAQDSCGGRVLEQLFNNDEISSQMKKAIVMKLDGLWTQLAMSSTGSHLLEACFEFAKPELRKRILENLVQNQQEICQTSWGSAAFRHCQQISIRPDEMPKPKKSKRDEELNEGKKTNKKKRKTQNPQKVSFCPPTYTH